MSYMGYIALDISAEYSRTKRARLLGTHLSLWCTRASQICLDILVYMAHHGATNRRGMLHMLLTLIHHLLVHQSEPKPSMQRGCLYRILILDLAKENAQLFFGKARQITACRARFSMCSSVFLAICGKAGADPAKGLLTIRKRQISSHLLKGSFPFLSRITFGLVAIEHMTLKCLNFWSTL